MFSFIPRFHLIFYILCDDADTDSGSDSDLEGTKPKRRSRVRNAGAPNGY
jgi:hypothetical protein